MIDMITGDGIRVTQKQLDEVYTKQPERFYTPGKEERHKFNSKIAVTGNDERLGEYGGYIVNRTVTGKKEKVIVPYGADTVDISISSPGTTEELDIVIPFGVREIQRLSVYAIDRMRIVLPCTLESIGEVYIPDVGLNSVYIPNKVESIKRFYVGVGDIEIGTGSGKKISIADYGLYCNKVLRSIKFNNGVKSIGEKAFYMCRKLEVVDGVETAEYIGNDAFGKTGIKCKGLLKRQCGYFETI